MIVAFLINKFCILKFLSSEGTLPFEGEEYHEWSGEGTNSTFV